MLCCLPPCPPTRCLVSAPRHEITHSVTTACVSLLPLQVVTVTDALGQWSRDGRRKRSQNCAVAFFFCKLWWFCRSQKGNLLLQQMGGIEVKIGEWKNVTSFSQMVQVCEFISCHERQCEYVRVSCARPHSGDGGRLDDRHSIRLERLGGYLRAVMYLISNSC